MARSVIRTVSLPDPKRPETAHFTFRYIAISGMYYVVDKISGRAASDERFYARREATAHMHALEAHYTAK